MGHLAGKDIYRDLGKKIDHLSVRAPWSRRFREILHELYTPEEALLITSMPFVLSNAEKIALSVGGDLPDVRKTLGELCRKGLVMDIWNGREFLYAVSPMVIGIFEFTMMRTDGGVDRERISRLFHGYMLDSDAFFKANFGKGQQVSVMRTLPYAEAVENDEFVEVYDYEKAGEIIDRTGKFCVGICSCRHKQEHLGTRQCSVPLETCTTLGSGADYLVRNNLAREMEKQEMKDILGRSRDLGLTITADNVKNHVGFLCHCCGCCCTIMQGIKKFGTPNIIKTSRFIMKADARECIGCGKCVRACPVDAVSLVPGEKGENTVGIDEDICLGCGVCALQCPRNALALVPRKQRVLLPEDVFERIILQSLERNTLQNLIIDNPETPGLKFLRGLIGGFLRLNPVQKALMSDSLRSKFLEKIREAAR